MTQERMRLKDAEELAWWVVGRLRPHCERIEIAGSIRRRRQDVGDIEIVCIPRTAPARTLFDMGDANERDPSFVQNIRAWHIVKGNPETGKYIQCILKQGPQDMKLDVFTATADNWGLIYAIRTGSAAYSHRILATGWVRNGYHSEGGTLRKNGETVPTPEETDLFERAGV